MQKLSDCEKFEKQKFIIRNPNAYAVIAKGFMPFSIFVIDIATCDMSYGIMRNSNL